MAESAAAAKERQVLELRRAGVTFDVIAQRVGYANRSSARRAYTRALERTGQQHEPEEVRELEVDRLDRLLAAVWQKAARGDLAAVDRVLKISERRDRLAGVASENTGALRKAFDQSVEANRNVDDDLDAALVAAGRRLADRIDAAVALGDGQEANRAMYLMPHLVNIMREMLATPAARNAVQKSGSEKGSGRLGQLRSIPRPA